MNRKRFLRQAVLGTAAAMTPIGLLKAGATTHDKRMKRIGFNHLPNQEIKDMNSVLHKANTRGHANHGWLDSHHSFSFANYYNPERMHFGVLRVLNDDVVSGGKGFGTHPHENMEIISIPLEGDLEHKDSMGTTAIIKKGDIQVMSAGTGIFHSEYNKNENQAVKFLQIWIFPNQKNVSPRYDQISLDQGKLHNTLYQILSPNAEDEGVWIHQNAWFHMGSLDQGTELSYTIKDPSNGVYTFVLEGNVSVNGQSLSKRDGFGVWNTPELAVKADSQTNILLMEVPMHIS